MTEPTVVTLTAREAESAAGYLFELAYSKHSWSLGAGPLFDRWHDLLRDCGLGPTYRATSEIAAQPEQDRIQALYDFAQATEDMIWVAKAAFDAEEKSLRETIEELRAERAPVVSEPAPIIPVPFPEPDAEPPPVVTAPLVVPALVECDACHLSFKPGVGIAAHRRGCPVIREQRLRERLTTGDLAPKRSMEQPAAEPAEQATRAQDRIDGYLATERAAVHEVAERIRNTPPEPVTDDFEARRAAAAKAKADEAWAARRREPVN